MTDPTRFRQNDDISRRRAMLQLASGALTAATALGAVKKSVAAEKSTPRREFAFFSKPFQSLSYDQLGELAAQSGYTGIEFPLRPGGHIAPEAVETELPKAVAAFAKHGITIPLISTGINEVSESQHTMRVLRTAKALGIPRFRMAYYRYDLKKPIEAQLEAISPKLDELVAAAEEVGIKPLYQNHSGGRYVGAPIWDMHGLMRRHRPEKIGLAFDIGHAIVEGSKCWPIQFALVKDYIDVAYIKDPAWNSQSRQFDWAPIGSGLIPKDYYRLLADSGFNGPMSIHVEYFDHNDPANHDRFREAIRSDLAALRAAVE